MVSFIVPAHNEAQIIQATVAALHESARGVGDPYEILVVDDASTDGTADLARRAGATVVPATLRHIAAARNVGGRAAKGDELLFVDADTWVPGDTAPNPIRRPVRAITRPPCDSPADYKPDPRRRARASGIHLTPRNRSA